MLKLCSSRIFGIQTTNEVSSAMNSKSVSEKKRLLGSDVAGALEAFGGYTKQVVLRWAQDCPNS